MKKIFMLFFILQPALAVADELTDMYQSMTSTQALMTDPSKRSQALDTGAAQKADKLVEGASMGNAQYKEEMYGIAAALMPWILQLTEGNPAKAQEMLREAKRDPKAFMERLPASEQARIKKLGQSIDQDRAAKGLSPLAAP